MHNGNGRFDEDARLPLATAILRFHDYGGPVDELMIRGFDAHGSFYVDADFGYAFRYEPCGLTYTLDEHDRLLAVMRTDAGTTVHILDGDENAWRGEVVSFCPKSEASL